MKLRGTIQLFAAVTPDSWVTVEMLSDFGKTCQRASKRVIWSSLHAKSAAHSPQLLYHDK